MLRKHITWLRMKGAGIILPLDNHIDIHKIIGIIILFQTIVHVAAHMAYLSKLLLFICILFYFFHIYLF